MLTSILGFKGIRDGIGYFKRYRRYSVLQKYKIKPSLPVSKNQITIPFDRETGQITMGDYGETKKFFNRINRKTDLNNLSYSIDPIIKNLSIWMQ